MGDFSYLYVSDDDRLPGGFPGDEGGKNTLVRLFRNTIPLLWLAMFKNEDLHFSVHVEASETIVDSICFVAPREACLERFRNRRPRLKALLPSHHECLDQWEKELERLDCRLLKLELGEIIDEGPPIKILSWFDVFDSPTKPALSTALSFLEGYGGDNDGNPIVDCNGDTLYFRDEAALTGGTLQRWWGADISPLGWATLFGFVLAAAVVFCAILALSDFLKLLLAS